MDVCVFNVLFFFIYVIIS